MWRKSSHGWVVIFLSLFTACTLSPSEHDPQFKRDANHSGVFLGQNIVIQPSVKWKFKTDGRVFSSPIAWNQTVYVGSDDGNLYALNMRNGSLAWKFSTGDRIRSTPAFYNNTIFFLSYDGIFYAVDAPTGAPKWSFKTAGEQQYKAPGIHGLLPADQIISDDWDIYQSSPAIANGHIYFGSGDGNVYALDAMTGNELWRFKTGDVVHSSPAVNDGMIFIGSWDRNMYALDASSGKEIWRFTTGSDTIYHNQIGIQGSPLISDSLLYFGCRDSHIYCLNKYTGHEKWRFDAKGSWVIATPTLLDNKLYAATSDSHRFLILDPLTGKVLSENDTKTYVFGSPVTTEGIVYVPTFGGALMAFDAQTAKLLWTWRTQAAEMNKQDALNDEGYYNPNIFFSRNAADTPAEMDRIYSVGSILSTPWIENGVIYFGSTDSTIYALHAP